MKKEETVDYHIKTAWHTIARMYNQIATRHEITYSMGFVLLNISSTDGTPATKIGPQLGLESRSLTRILKSMEEKSLIFKKSDPSDKRLVRICLTDKGKRKKEIARKTVIDFNKLVRSEISADKLNHFLDCIKQIQYVMENKIQPQTFSAS